jgi:hypothetical protein
VGSWLAEAFLRWFWAVGWHFGSWERVGTLESRADGGGCEGVQSLSWQSRHDRRYGTAWHPIDEGTAERPERRMVGLLSIRGQLVRTGARDRRYGTAWQLGADPRASVQSLSWSGRHHQRK